jgi:DnaJ-class molecular chaperone
MKQNVPSSIAEKVKTIMASHNKCEMICLTCDGAGTLADPGSKQTFQVKLCTSCNGHGVIVYAEFQGAPRKIAYAATEEANCIFES